MGFLDNIFKDDKKKPNNAGNPLGNMFGGQKKFQGAGNSLGGSKPGTVIAISLPDAGPLGVRVERRSNSEKTAIVHEVVKGSQAEIAGMRRGDILCFAGSNGQVEITYEVFLDLAKNDQRPIELEVRRISTSLDKKTGAASRPKGSNVGKSADAEARRKAVIAAAEAREKAHKIKSKPIKQVTKATLAKQQAMKEQQQLRLQEQGQSGDQEPKSEESRLAAEMAKHQEAQVAAQLGYNPYETSRSTAGQARTATAAVQHGSMSSNTPGDHQSMPSVATPKDLPALEAHDDDHGELPFEFRQAKATMVSSTDHDRAVLSSSCNIIKKLLVNATTKGRMSDKEDASKFRKVRLANAKIRAAIVDVDGAVELLLSCGFWLDEQDGESVLLYPADTPVPEWLPAAFKQLEALI